MLRFTDSGKLSGAGRPSGFAAGFVQKFFLFPIVFSRLLLGRRQTYPVAENALQPP